MSPTVAKLLHSHLVRLSNHSLPLETWKWVLAGRVPTLRRVQSQDSTACHRIRSCRRWSLPLSTFGLRQVSQKSITRPPPESALSLASASASGSHHPSTLRWTCYRRRRRLLLIPNPLWSKSLASLAVLGVSDYRRANFPFHSRSPLPSIAFEC